MARAFFRLIFFLLFPAFFGCQTGPRVAEVPSAVIKRSADTPLVIAIPGLNVPFSPSQDSHFGQITAMLEKAGIPSCVLIYDDATHPLRDAADLSASDYSIAVTRLLPDIVNAVRRENEIRASQGLPPLREANLVTFSQGAIMGLDIVRRIHDFRNQFEDYLAASGNEWEIMQKDPELELFSSTALDYVIIKNIRIQRQKEFDSDPDFKRFWARANDRLAKAFERFRTYLADPGKIYPETPIRTGAAAGYPRRYPKTLKWFRENFPADDPTESIPLDFCLQYAEYRDLLPVNFRFFSITGSFFGSPRANTGYFLLRSMGGLDRMIMSRADLRQIEETRLGSHHHLDTIKQVLSSEDFKDTDKNYKDYYFVVGVHGGRGDGLVDQSSAHLSSHLYTQVRLEDLIGKNHNGTAKGNGILRFEWKRLPSFQVTGLDIYHLPQNQILVRTEGAAHMDKNSKTFPYLLAFVKKDFNKLKDLHRRHVRKLRQFMVELNLPESDRLTGYDFTLRPSSRDIALSGRFFNPSTNTIVWTGVFKSRKNFLDFEEMDPARSGRVILKGTKPFVRTFEVELLVNPGTNHFVEVVSAEESNKKFKLPLPSIYDFIPKNEFFRLMKGEK